MPTEGAVSGSLIAVPLTPLQLEITNARKATQKLQEAINTLVKQRHDDERELAKAFAKQLATTPVDVQNTLTMVNAWKTKDDEKARQLEALRVLADKLKALNDYYVENNREDVRAALTSLLGDLRRQFNLEEAQADELKALIDTLEHELKSLGSSKRRAQTESAQESSEGKT
jgi:hypothetical protein